MKLLSCAVVLLVVVPGHFNVQLERGAKDTRGTFKFKIDRK